jgi:hypothetical protein
MRGKVTPARKASEKVDEWREMSDNCAVEEENTERITGPSD